MRIGLGGARFGMQYGFPGNAARMPLDEVRAVLALAHERGVRVLDGAPIYGDCEERIGALAPAAAFKLVTKVPPLRWPERGAWARSPEAGLRASLEHLHVPAAYGLLVHAADDLLDDRRRADGLWSALQRLRDAGLVAKIGASVYTPSQLERLFEWHQLELVQLPLSVFDQRFPDGGHLAELKRRGVEIHVRSVFLQGLLLQPSAELPAYFAPLRAHVDAYRGALLAHGLTPLEGALSFALACPEVDSVICGVDDSVQLAQVLAAAESELDPAPWRDFGLSDEAFLNPSRWPKGLTS